MPVPWYVPIIASSAGNMLSAGAGAKAANQDRAARERDAQRQQVEDDRDRMFDQRNYNDRVGSASMMNPMKMAMLQKLAGKRGIDMGGMNLPDVSKYRAPVPYDYKREEEAMRARDPRAEMERLMGQAKGFGAKNFRDRVRDPEWQRQMQMATQNAKQQQQNPNINQQPLTTVDLMRRRMGA